MRFPRCNRLRTTNAMHEAADEAWSLACAIRTPRFVVIYVSAVERGRAMR